MSEVIYLAHRLPYPPNKGDKIRSFHLLRQLSNQFDIHLGCFVDDKDDIQYIDTLTNYCKSTCIRPLRPIQARLKSLKGFWSGEALTIPYYNDNMLQQWVEQTLRRNNVTAIIGYSSPMAQYVHSSHPDRIRKIMDFVDVDSDKWRQYAAQTSFPMSWVYAREARRLAVYEENVTRNFDAVTFVSDAEAELFSAQHPNLSHKIYAACNGVDTDYFDPVENFSSPFSAGAKPIVFTGMMNYWPNEDAMQWFAKSVFPKIRQSRPETELWIVGASPTKGVVSLETGAGVHVTGRVEDVRPFLQHASVIIAPLRIARGVQNKVLEALAMGKKVICSSEAAAGLSDIRSAAVDIANSENEFVQMVLHYFSDGGAGTILEEARNYTLKYYDWSRNLGIFEKLIQSDWQS